MTWGQLFLFGALLAVQMVVALWILRDAQDLRRNGAKLIPDLWVGMALIAWPAVLPAYLFVRSRHVAEPVVPEEDLTPETPEAQSQRILGWVFAFVGSGVVAMIAAALTSLWNPWPDNGFFDIGFFLFYLVVSLDLYFLIDQFVLGRSRKPRMSVGKALAIFGGVLLLAPLLAMWPWAWAAVEQRWPWLPDLLWSIYFVALLASVFRNARKSARGPNAKPPAPTGPLASKPW